MPDIHSERQQETEGVDAIGEVGKTGLLGGTKRETACPDNTLDVIGRFRHRQSSGVVVESVMQNADR